MRLSFLYLVGFSFFESAFLQSAFAQEPLVIQEEEKAASVIIYDHNYFAPYNPITAEDLLNRIPGAEGLVGGFGDQQEERRGLRSNTDQILINGKRLTGKENQSSAFLEKLPAKSVERIEIITGNVRELDADVGARVINVVLKEGAGLGSGVGQIGILGFPSGQKRAMGSLSYSGSSGDLSYNLSAQMRPGVSPVDVVDVITTAGGGRLRVIEESRRQDQVQYETRGSLTYNWPSGKTMSFNGFLQHFPLDNEDTTISFLDPGDAPLVNTGTVIDRIKGEDTTWEIGGDYAQSFGASVKFTGLFVYSNGSVDRDNGFFRKTSNDLSQVGGDTKIQETTEKIIRGTFDWNISRSHDLEIGAEGATNILDKNLDFFSLLGGVRIDTPVLNSDQRITEDRVEIFSTHSWKPLGGMEIESGLAAESSWLDQVGSDVSSNRSLKFLKPSLDIWYNSDDSTQMWFSFRRDVGQLDFDDFVATVNREDNEVLAGNPDLVPEKSWDFEVGIERRLIGGAGLVNGRIFFRRVNDVKDLVPFSLTSSQPGNLGSGNHYGFEVESSIRFGRFTSVDAVLSGSILMQKSEVADPFTGVKRRFGNQPEYEYKLEARHDVKTQGLSYGFDLSKEGPTLESDFNEFDSKATTLDARIFLEKGINDGTVMRFFWANLLEVKALRTRRIFDPSQAAGTIKEIQFREQKRGYIYGFRVRTTF